MMEDWVECTLGEILSVSSGKGLTSKNMDGGKYPVYGGNGITGYHSKKIFDEKKLIIGRVGVRCGVTHITNRESWVTDNALVVTLKNNCFNLSFMKLKLQFANLNKLSSSTAQPVISGTKIYSYQTEFPPVPIQRAIVSKIESLFSSLDSGIADLIKAQEQLRIYRQAVLKKAFEGNLTKEWREKQTELPSAEELLKHIEDKRQKYYGNQIADWSNMVMLWEKNRKVGKKPGKPKALKSAEPFTEIEIDRKDKLPNNWSWTKLGNVFQVFVGSTPSRRIASYWNEGEINWVSSGEVKFKPIAFTKEKISIEGLQNTSTIVHPIGTVMLAMIGEGKTRGQAGILKIEACHNQNTAAIRVSEMGMEPKFLFHYFFLKYERNRSVGSGNNQKALNQGRILNFDFPLCSVNEQNQVVKEIESRLSVCDKVEKDINDSLVKAKALRQSILKKAFGGKLLTVAEIERCKQEADYEPASVLLERIKKEKKK